MASKKSRKAPKNGPVWRLSAEEATLAGKPRFNGFACGSGVHGDRKYNRTHAKQAWQKEIRNERASTRGPLEFTGSKSPYTMLSRHPYPQTCITSFNQPQTSVRLIAANTYFQR